MTVIESQKSQPDDAPDAAQRSDLRRDCRGAVYVEFLIAFLPVYTFFLCVIQLGLLFTVRLVTEHAAINAARAAAVVIGDEPKRYDNEAPNVLAPDGKRDKAVRSAALLTLTPLIFNGVVQSVKVYYPPSDQPDGKPQTGTLRYSAMTESSVEKVRVRVEVEAACRIALAAQIACSGSLFSNVSQQLLFFLPTRMVRAEAIFPYQGASYEYPP
jgi:hypothetical protein